MNTINLSEEQSNSLCNEIVDVVFDFKKNKGVECIYLTPHVTKDRPYTNIVSLTVVVDDTVFNEIYDKSNAYNRKNNDEERIDMFGSEMYVIVEKNYRYSMDTQEPSKSMRMKELYNSKILYDATANCYYSKIKNKAEELANGQFSKICLYSNIAEFVPPIDLKLETLMEEVQGKIDCEAVKKFTKSPMSDYMANL